MADQSQYKYANMSNLVLQVDKRFTHRRTDEATGDPESLAGKVDIKQMGDRALRDNAPKEKHIKKKKQLKEKDIDGLEDGKEEKRKRKREYVLIPVLTLITLRGTRFETNQQTAQCCYLTWREYSFSYRRCTRPRIPSTHC